MFMLLHGYPADLSLSSWEAAGPDASLASTRAESFLCGRQCNGRRKLAHWRVRLSEIARVDALELLKQEVV